VDLREWIYQKGQPTIISLSNCGNSRVYCRTWVKAGASSHDASLELFCRSTRIGSTYHWITYPKSQFLKRVQLKAKSTFEDSNHLLRDCETDLNKVLKNFR
jgi:hypothetical protein